MRAHNLNFDWQYQPDFKEEYLLKDFDDKDFAKVNIPHTNLELPYNNFAESSYQFVSTYRKNITVTKEMLEKRLVLEFEGAAVFSEVFINGKFAFSHKGAYTKFGQEVNEFLEVGENVIAVKLDSTEREEIPPFGGVVDYLVYGGIYREVYLYEYEQNYIKMLHVHTEDVLTRKPKAIATVYLNQPAAGKDLTVWITDKAGAAIASQTITLGEDTTVSCKFDTPDIKLWDCENPNLYTITAKLENEKRSDRFGYREAVFKRKGFYLNGKLTKIRGLNRHQSFPYVGNAMPASAQIADADLCKFKLGLNLARTSHYPNSKHFLNRCDEIGLLVFTEIPGWQFVSKLPEWRQLVLQDVEDMIQTDYNHPSIILWGVRINESGDDGELYTKTNKLARELDPSRQTGGVRVIPFSQFLEDVYTTNDFTHSGKKPALLPKTINGGIGKPYLVTEHNGHMFPTKTYDYEGKRQSQALRHARVLDTAYRKNGTSGAIGWCMSDYNTHKDFGSGDKICYHGVTDMFRCNKMAAWTYASQSNDKPFLECSSNFEIGDHAGGKVGDVYFFTNVETIKVYKNDEYINTIDVKKACKKSKYKHLPHPIISFDDLIGNQLEVKEGFSKSKANRIKKFISLIFKHGTFGAIIRKPITAAISAMSMGITGITDIFGRYASTWGSEQNNYRFEGLIGDEVVASCQKGSINKKVLVVKPDTLKLNEGNTYDVARVEVNITSQYGNVLPYESGTLTVSADSGLEIIGPKNFAVIGGQRAFWVKTTGQTGNFKVTVESEELGTQTITFNVTKN